MIVANPNHEENMMGLKLYGSVALIKLGNSFILSLTSKTFPLAMALWIGQFSKDDSAVVVDIFES